MDPSYHFGLLAQSYQNKSRRKFYILYSRKKEAIDSDQIIQVLQNLLFSLDHENILTIFAVSSEWICLKPLVYRSCISLA